jgi:CheY-like chemotaxis protein
MMTRVGRILCIGRSPIELNLRCGLLREHGWDVVSAGTGYEGVFQFGKEAVDAVVVDLDDDGSEAALITAELKRQGPKVPIVFLIEAGKTLANGAADQADAVVFKSEETEKLISVLTQLLGQN